MVTSIGVLGGNRSSQDSKSHLGMAISSEPSTTVLVSKKHRGRIGNTVSAIFEDLKEWEKLNQIF
jgi:hypothetical protein